MDSSAPDNDAVFSKKVQIADIRPRYQVLRKTLEASGVAPENTNALLVDHMFATCTQCGIPVSGADLKSVAHASGAVDPDQPKVVRLSQGYCARKSCDSHFYNLNFRAAEGVDWEWLWSVASGQGNVVGELRDEKERGAVREIAGSFDRRSWLVIAACVTAMGLVAYLQLRTPAYSSRPSGFQVDTNSLILSVDPRSVR